MDRTVPQTGSEEIELYMRTYYSLLRSSDSIKIETLVESHLAMRSSLHEHAADAEPDASALMYSALRLPPCIIQTDEVLIGQMDRSFIAAGYRDIEAWTRVYATGRRRRTHFNGEDSLAVYAQSRSDIDDLVPILTAFQIEWNKLHQLLQNSELADLLRPYAAAGDLPEEDFAALAAGLRMRVSDLKRLHLLWAEEFVDNLLHISEIRKSMTLRLDRRFPGRLSPGNGFLVAGALRRAGRGRHRPRRAPGIFCLEQYARLDQLAGRFRPPL